MPMKGTSEADGVQLSCMELTEPFDVSVTEAPQIADDDTPARTSLPSMFPPPWSAVIDWFAPTAVSVGCRSSRRSSPNNASGDPE